MDLSRLVTLEKRLPCNHNQCKTCNIRILFISCLYIVYTILICCLQKDANTLHLGLNNYKYWQASKSSKYVVMNSSPAPAIEIYGARLARTRDEPLEEPFTAAVAELSDGTSV